MVKMSSNCFGSWIVSNSKQFNSFIFLHVCKFIVDSIKSCSRLWKMGYQKEEVRYAKMPLNFQVKITIHEHNSCKSQLIKMRWKKRRRRGKCVCICVNDKLLFIFLCSWNTVFIFSFNSFLIPDSVGNIDVLGTHTHTHANTLLLL